LDETGMYGVRLPKVSHIRKVTNNIKAININIKVELDRSNNNVPVKEDVLHQRYKIILLVIKQRPLMK